MLEIMQNLQSVPLTQRDVDLFLSQRAQNVVRIYYDTPKRGDHHWFAGICRNIRFNGAKCSLNINPFFSLGSQREVVSLLDDRALFSTMSRPIAQTITTFEPTFEQWFTLESAQKLILPHDRPHIIAISFTGGTALISSSNTDMEKFREIILTIIQNENHQKQKLIRELLQV